MISIQLTVFYEDPYWVGIFEKKDQNHLSACKVTFGSEPKDYQIWAYLLEHYSRLDFSPTLCAPLVYRKINPKRMQRDIHRQVQKQGVGTKSQIALQLQKESIKLVAREGCRKRREESDQRQFALRQQKKKEKKKGH